MVLAARRRQGWTVEEVMITQAVEGDNFQSLLLADTAPVEKQDLLVKAGVATAQWHSAGFLHGDLLPGNLIVDRAGNLVFMDNDRTLWLTRRMPLFLRRRNLAQMAFRILVISGEDAGRRYLQAYFDAAHPIRRSRRHKATEWVMKKARRRLAELEEKKKESSKPDASR
jgi:predicted unusual protein kinase regulating ubiquinone biosynthesis (AarF/ABC1/UbiB family)